MAQFAPKEKKVSKKSEPIGWQVVYHRAAEDGPKTGRRQRCLGLYGNFFEQANAANELLATEIDGKPKGP